MQSILTLTLISLLLLIATPALAQVGPQAQQLPACIKTCDPPAIASVNCTNADQYCHCVRQNGILSNITACADVECADPRGSLDTFTTLFGEVCAQFDIQVPVVGGSSNSSTSANGTMVAPPSGSGSVVPYTGSATAATSRLETLCLAMGAIAIALIPSVPLLLP